MTHHWSDESFHGSPQYFCEYCGVSRTEENHLGECPKTQEVEQRQKHKELAELGVMLNKVNRFVYLFNKHGTPYDKANLRELLK